MKKRMLIIGVILVAIMGLMYYWLRSSKKTKGIFLTTSTAAYGYIANTVTATGTVEPVDTVLVGAQVSGLLKKVYVDFNDVVRQGQLLAKIDPSIFNEQQVEATANLANTKSNLEYQQANFNRQQELFNLGGISQSDYQLAVNQYKNAKAAVDNAQALLRVAQRNIYYTNIYSPINGVVLNRNVNAGQTIAASFAAPTLFVIARDLTKMEVNAAVDEADIGGVRSGDRVSFTVDAFPDDIFNGNVRQVVLEPSVSSNVVTYPTKIIVNNKELKLKPGMTASVNIYVQEDSNALLIPSKALTFKPDSTLLKKFVLLKNNLHSQNPGGNIVSIWIKKRDTLVEKNIFIGINDDSRVEVKRGLAAGEIVVTGIQTEAKAAGAGNSQHSPFIPQMSRSNRSTSPGSHK
jgi:HlyD family secretion protein